MAVPYAAQTPFKAREYSFLFQEVSVNPAPCFQTVDPAALGRKFFFIFGHHIVKIALVQIERNILQEPAILANLPQRPLEQTLVIRLEKD